MIDKKMLQEFRNDFADAVKTLEQKYGIVIELGQISYTATSFDGKIKCREGASKDDANAADFRHYCKMYGLDEDDYDRRFTYGGDEYVIVGIRPSKRKYPIACTQLKSGQTYGFTAATVRQQLGK